jgi:signal transduction histidine kinase
MNGWRSWMFFAACMLIGLGALTWVTRVVLRLEEAERESKQRAILEENTRLALWRTDSVMSAFIVRESARPHFAYRPFYPAQIAIANKTKLLSKGEILIPSSLLNQSNPHVFLHFQSEANGLLSSPQVPTGVMCDVAEQSDCAQSSTIESAGERLKTLAQFFKHNEVIKKLNSGEAYTAMGRSYYELNLQTEQRKQLDIQSQGPRARYNTSNYSSDQQKKRSRQELGARAYNNRWSQTTTNAGKNRLIQQIVPKSKRVPIEESVMQAIWLGEHLLLARQVKVDKKVYVQGCWLDWPKLKDELTGSLTDLLPNAQLVKSTDSSKSSSRMASIPVEVIAGLLPIDPGSVTSPRAVSLGIAWSACLIAALALAVLLSGLLSLSERRGAFVSAVTHELRTPLTTFRVYTEMLADGMVPTEEKRQKYLRTLKREADRLGHLVNNVLAYAMLEGGRSKAEYVESTVGELLENVTRSLPEVASRAGIPFSIDKLMSVSNQFIRTDASCVEQVLVNLVDNACKYGKAESEPEIKLSVGIRSKDLALTVRDNGPGVLRSDRRRIFTPFFKSATEAAHSAPGVGLGLALCRRLAKQLGGRLEMADDQQPGAAFSLILPLHDEITGL